MKKTVKLLSLLLAALVALSLGGCLPKLPGLNKPPLPTPNVAPPAPTAAAPSNGGKSNTPAAPDENAAEAAQKLLDELDREMFVDSVTGDALSYHLSLAHPENFAEITEVEPGFGEFTYAASEAATQREREWLLRLKEIDREVLDDCAKLTYDTLLQYLELSISYFDYYYYSEVLDSYSGAHSNLPLNMVFYDMHTKADVESYLALLGDMPRYIGQMLAFEREKSAEGKFMRDNALNQVLEQIQAVIDEKESFFLLATFDEFIGDIAELTEAERNAYSLKNAKLVADMIDAYQLLYNGLEQLRGTATNENGLCEYGEEGKRFFALGVKDAACADISVEDALSILKKEQASILAMLGNAAAKDPSFWDKYGTINLNLGTTQENIDYLESLMWGYYPPLPAHTLTFMDCPEVLEDQFSPAAYLVPPVDDASENLIILNAKTLGDETQYISTIAHEGYPGHLYHYQYLRMLSDKTGYTRQNLSLTGYYESWSQSAEVFFAQNNDKFPNDYCTFMFANDSLTNLTLPAICSIFVNYYGYDLAKLADYLKDYFGDESAMEMAEIYHELAVEHPFYFLEYALGFSIYQQQLIKAEKTCKNFDLLDYNKTFLEIGPTFFNISMPIMDEWIAEHK